MGDSTIISGLVQICKSKSTDSQYINAPGYELVIENVEVKAKVSIARKVRSTGAYSVPWVINDQSDGCMRCRKPFGVFNWRHHCRKCGYLVCHSCSDNRIPIITLIKTLNPARACSACYREHHQRAARRQQGREDTPEEEPEPLLTRVPSWVQGSAERGLEPRKSSSAKAKKMRRISEHTPHAGEEDNSEGEDVESKQVLADAADAASAAPSSAALGESSAHMRSTATTAADDGVASPVEDVAPAEPEKEVPEVTAKPATSGSTSDYNQSPVVSLQSSPKAEERRAHGRSEVTVEKVEAVEPVVAIAPVGSSTTEAAESSAADDGPGDDEEGKPGDESREDSAPADTSKAGKGKKSRRRGKKN